MPIEVSRTTILESNEKICESVKETWLCLGSSDDGSDVVKA